MVVGVTVVLTVIPTTLSSSARLHKSTADYTIPNNEVHWITIRQGLETPSFPLSITALPSATGGVSAEERWKYLIASIHKSAIESFGKKEKKNVEWCEANLQVMGPSKVQKTSQSKTETSPIIERPKYPQKSQR